MSFTTYRTWVAGAILTAAQGNEQWRDNGNIVIVGINTSDGSLKGPLKGYGETKQSASISAGVVTIDYSLGNHVEIALTAAITSFVLTNVPTTGADPLVLYFTADGTVRAITWSITANGHTTTAKFPGAVNPTMTGTNTKVDEILITTRDAWVTTWGKVLGQNS